MPSCNDVIDIDICVIMWWLNRPCVRAIVQWLNVSWPSVRSCDDLNDVCPIFKHDGASFSATISSSNWFVWSSDEMMRLFPLQIPLLIGSSDLQTQWCVFFRDKSLLPIGPSDLQTRSCVLFRDRSLLLIGLSGLQGSVARTISNNDRPFLIISYVTRWSKFTLHYALCRACRM